MRLLKHKILERERTRDSAGNENTQNRYRYVHYPKLNAEGKVILHIKEYILKYCGGEKYSHSQCRPAN